ncbi:MAG: SdpI family protein [Candidatus Paceibacterota bacterium]
MRKTACLISLSIVILAFIFAFYFYPQMPQLIASHWNDKGEVNGMTEKWMLFLIPAIIVFCFVMFIFIPRIEPKKENIKEFKDSYDDFILIFNLFMFYLFALTIIWNLGYSFNMTVGIMPGLSVLFYFLGILVAQTKRNYTIGIRTPWTLENDKVWESTSKVSGVFFKTLGLSCLFFMLFPKYAFLLFFSFLIIGIIYIFFYSYSEYKKQIKRKNK